jgi:Arc/MetJ-type ribon-helix-helix transcriptional regulator
VAENTAVRLDEDARRALDVLARDGTSVSAAIRAALVDAASARARDQLRAEAAALAADEEDRPEATRVLSDMETLRAW